MICRTAFKAIVTITFLIGLSCGALAQNGDKAVVQPLPFVSPIFGDNMVLATRQEQTPSGAGPIPATRFGSKSQASTRSGVAGPIAAGR